MLNAIAFKEIIYHFPLVILDLSLVEIEATGFLPMTNLKLPMENDK
jgi:hypothetical protein